MRATRYSVPFFISCCVHIVAIALLPGDFFHRAGAREHAPSIRLRVITPGNALGGKGILGGVREKQPLPKELKRKIERREDALFHRKAKKIVSGEQMKKKVGDMQAKVPERGPDPPLMQGHGEKIAKKQVKIPEGPDGMDETRGENVSLAPVNRYPVGGAHGKRGSSPSFDKRDGGMSGKKSSRLIHDAVTEWKGSAPFFSPPVIASIPEPYYPEVSRRNGEEGVVMLSVAIDDRGRGGEIEVLLSSGYGRLDRAAISALKRARFIPAKEGGRAVSSVKKIAIRFALEEGD